VPHPATTKGHPCAFLLPTGRRAPKAIYDTSSIREPSKVVLNMLKLMEKHFIDPKRNEILSVFQVFPCTMQLPFFGPKLLPAIFLNFEILAESLII
jgi:hypothetical protein